MSMTATKAPPHVLRVLCVDDNRDFTDTTAALLRIHGYDVRTGYSGRAALAAVDAGYEPDVCLIDLNMPGMDGDEVAAAVLARLPDNPPVLIAVTAMSGPDNEARTRRAGFAAHFVKPVVVKQLLAVIAELDW